MNLVLLLFNLVPALPLDGGRVLRAGLWWLKHDLGWATLVAAGVSRALSIGMIGLGALVFLAGGGITGLWLALIGWFVLSAAGSEARHRPHTPSPS